MNIDANKTPTNFFLTNLYFLIKWKKKKNAKTKLGNEGIRYWILFTSRNR